MATKKMTKATGPKMKKYNEGGSSTSRKFDLFGKTYEKKVTRIKNDDGTTTVNKVKMVSSKDGDPIRLKEKSRTMIDAYDEAKSSVTKTKFMGGSDSKTKSRGYNLPSNLSEEKKGGSVKSKKVIKSKKK